MQVRTRAKETLVYAVVRDRWDGMSILDVTSTTPGRLHGRWAVASPYYRDRVTGRAFADSVLGYFPTLDEAREARDALAYVQRRASKEALSLKRIQERERSSMDHCHKQAFDALVKAHGGTTEWSNDNDE